MKSKNIRIFFFFILAIFIFEFAQINIFRKIRRRYAYKLAVEKSNRTNKKLLVLGDPFSGNTTVFTGVDYGCGDITFDINGSPLCPIGKKVDLNTFDFGEIQSNTVVIFASCILEYVEDLPRIFQELERISGGDMFVVNIEPYTIKTHIFKNVGYGFERKWLFWKTKPFYPIFEFQRFA